MAHIFILSYILFFAFSYPLPTMSRLHNNFTDLESLLAFKDHVNDPLGVLATNWTTNTFFCNWIGISCSSRHQQRVTAVVLSSINLGGTIAPHLANLSFLSHLILHNCTLSGPIPYVLGHLPRLTFLNLQRNSLSGPIPSSICNMSSLTKFSVWSNNLVGPLPSNNDSHIMLPRLQFISLSDNQLTGKIPSSFAQCRDLQMLSLSINNFSGNIPLELGSLPELRELYLGLNQLTGTIPTSLGNLTNLNMLDLGNNSLTGPVPEELGKLSNLELLYLTTNQLNGSVPISLLNASMLNLFLVADNKLTGRVPVGIGRSMPFLRKFDVQANQQSGGLEFITSFSNCRDLEVIYLAQNEFEGFLPNSLGNLSMKLQKLSVSENKMRGSIPVVIGNLSSLVSLYLGANQLTGAIPSMLGRLERLEILDLGSNSLSDHIPSEVCQLRNLIQVDLSNNRFSGPIPYALGNLTRLQHLSLGNNTLSSSIPENLFDLTSLVSLILAFNFLDGIPVGGMGDMKTLNYLDLSNNRFSGNMSSVFGALQMLSYLDLSNNSFHGRIPKSFGELINIEYLNLSHNFLSDVIPKSLSDLRYLKHLDLSFNKLEGQIPQGRVFSNLTIALLQGNEALCGANQLGFPPCPEIFRTSGSKRSQHFFKYIIPAIASALVLLACLFLLMFLRRRRAKTHSNPDTLWLKNHRLISYHELVRATNNFSEGNLLGRGSCSSVFKACLDDGMLAAVKVINLEVEGASKSFDAECQVLSTIRHRNLVKVISTCSNLDFKSLILQFMQNGNLEKWLYSHNFYLNLHQRINIMVDVSLALEHLHHHHSHVVVHQDLKPSNVLLDENMVAYVGDFGIAKFLFGDSMAAVSASAPGTIGYIAPEYGSAGKISRKSDVYSFGILLLETFTRRKPTDEMFSGESSLRQWVSTEHPARVLEIVDGNILSDDSVGERTPEALTNIHECLSSIMELGLLCSNDLPGERIPMRDVVPRLQKIKTEYLSKLPGA